MKCLECGKEIEEGLSKCPHCGKEIEEDIELELPALKDEEAKEENPDLEKTRSLFGAKEDKDEPEEEEDSTEEIIEAEDLPRIKKEEKEETEEDEEPSEEEKEEVDENKEEHIEEAPATTEEILSTRESVRNRKQILLVMSICFCIVVLGMMISLFFIRDKDPNSNGSYIVSMEDALNEYFDKNDIDNVIFVLEDVKKDETKVKDIQRITRITCDSWMVRLVNENVETVDEYETLTDKYRGVINGLHDDAVVKNDNTIVKALNDVDYEDLIRQVNNIYSDGSSFFDALAMYNVKDYNKAYYMFGKIQQDNAYYDRAKEYSDKIVDNVLNILKTDIKKMEIGIDNLSNEEKLKKYIQIKDIIEAYKNTYTTLELDKNDKYIAILNEYRTKIGDLGNDKGVLANSGL